MLPAQPELFLEPADRDFRVDHPPVADRLAQRPERPGVEGQVGRHHHRAALVGEQPAHRVHQRRRGLQLAGGVGQRRRREAGLFEPPGQMVPDLPLPVGQFHLPAGGGHRVAVAPQPPGGRQVGHHPVGHRRRDARPFAQFLHRHPRPQAVRRLERREPREQPLPERPEPGRRHQQRVAGRPTGGDPHRPGLGQLRREAARLPARPPQPAGERRLGQPAGPGPVHEQQRRFPVVRRRQRRHRLPRRRAPRRPLGRERVHHLTAADGHHRRIPADDEPVAPERRHRALQPQLGENGLPRFDRRRAAEQPHPRERRRRAEVDMDPVLVADRGAGAGQDFQPAVQHGAGAEFPGRADHRAALHPLPADAGEVQRDALPGGTGLGGGAVDFEAADPGALPRPGLAAAVPAGQDFHLAPDRDAAGDHGSGDHRAEPPHREHPVHREAEEPVRVAGARGGGGGFEGGAQPVEPGAGDRGHRDDRGVGQRAPGEEVADFQFREFDQVRVVHQVAAGERDDRGPDPQQPADLEVLAGLGHDRLVGGDDQQHHIEPARPGEHVPDEPLVAGDIHEGVADAAGGEVREAQVHGDPPRLLFLEAVRIGPGEGANQRTLPVVDVAGGADHHMTHRRRL